MADTEDISELWEDALDRYEKMVPERSRRDRNLFITLKTPEALEEHLDKSEKSFKLFRSKHGKLTSRLKACMKPFMALSDMISAAVSASPFAPASTILGAVCFVLKAADGVSEVYSWIEELFDKLRDFTTRLDEYVQQGLPKGFRDKIVDIFGCLLEILACAELAVKDGRWKKYAAVLFLGGDERVKAAFDKLASLFQSEQALVLAITYATNQKMDKRIDEIGAMSEAILDATNKGQEEKSRQECMSWISNMDFTAQQSDNLGRRETNTGEWFLEDPTFISWSTGSSSSWALFCQGAPGAGKTTMSATVIDHLSRRGPADEVGVAYIYCNYRSRTDQTLRNLLSSLLRRLVQIRSTVPQSIKDAYSEFGQNRELSLQECTNLIASVCKEFSIVYMVVDAVDECQDDVARYLFRNLQSVQKQANVHLMMTARFIPAIQEMIEEELGKLPQLEVRASDEDIRRYFANRQTGFKNFLKNNKSLCALASDKVVETAGGMFLLARLHVDQLTAMVVPAQVKSALSRMFKASGNMSQSTAYDEQYDLAMERISSQPAYQVDLARATLTWLTFACRPLTPAELCTALAMELSENKNIFDQDYLPELGLVISICSGLVTVDEEANVVRPAHYTTQEYFERTHERWLPGGRKKTALTCVQYLSMDDFKEGVAKTWSYNGTDSEWEQRLQTYQLLDYAARYWGKHAQSVESDIIDMLRPFLEHFGIMSNISSVTSFYYQDAYVGDIRNWHQLTPMMAIASEGLAVALQKYLNNDLGKIWPEDDRFDGIPPKTIIAEAATKGHSNVVKILLTQTTDISLCHGSDEALISAAEGGYSDIVQAILNFWAESGNSHPLSTERILESRKIALKEAAAYGSMDTVRTLLDSGADTDAVNMTVNRAVSRGHEELTQFLLQRGGTISCTIAEAVQEECHTVMRMNAIRLLLKLGHDVDAANEEGRSALQIAALEGFQDIALLLLENGADPNFLGRHEEHALMAATQRGLKAASRPLLNITLTLTKIVRMLIDHGVHLDAYARDFRGDTALIVAARQCKDDDAAIVRLLLESGADVDLHYHGHAGNALQTAARYDYAELCEILIAHGSDVNFPSGDPEMTPFEVAYVQGSANVLQLLLKHGAEAPEDGLMFSGPFLEHWVRRRDRHKTATVLRLLAEHGVKLDLEGDGTHLPAIYEAARAGNLPVLQELLKLGADVHSQAGEHGNVLHDLLLDRAFPAQDDTDESYVECIGLLLDHGLDMHKPGHIHPDALSAAIASRQRLNRDGPHLAIPFLERGFRIPNYGPQLLEQAVANSIPEVIWYLLKGGISINTSIDYPNIFAAACHAPDPPDNFSVLLESGADLKTMGPRALHEAAALCKYSAVEWLLEQGVDANVPCDEYSNALITCVSVAAPEEESWVFFKTESTLKVLIEYGADVKVHGPAALDLAIPNGYNGAVRKLLGEVLEEEKSQEGEKSDEEEEQWDKGEGEQSEKDDEEQTVSTKPQPISIVRV